MTAPRNLETTLAPGLDVIVLAGGRGSRMGGRDKAVVRVDGQRLIDVLLDDVSMLPGVMQVVAVSSRDPQLRPGVKVVAEEPPFSGPVAAVAAGARALATEACTHTAVLAVDAPESSGLVPELLDALDEVPEADVAAVREVSGHLQPLCAVWRTRSLHRVLDEVAADGGLTDRAAKLLLARAEVVEVVGTGEERDYDTLADLADYGEVEE